MSIEGIGDMYKLGIEGAAENVIKADLNDPKKIQEAITKQTDSMKDSFSYKGRLKIMYSNPTRTKNIQVGKPTPSRMEEYIDEAVFHLIREDIRMELDSMTERSGEFDPVS